MEGSRRREKLLDLFPSDTDHHHQWLNQRHVDSCSSDDRDQLQLRIGLGPPNHHRQNDNLLSLGYYCSSPTTTTTVKTTSSFVSSENSNIHIKKKPTSSSSHTANTAVTNNTSQKRSAPATVVGWPPIRSCRKNLSKPATDLSSSSTSSQNNKLVNTNINNTSNNEINETNNGKESETCGGGGGGTKKGKFVKINMEGVPIGRKVNLKAHDTYHKLSSAVDQLFRGLLAAQRDCNGNNGNNQEEEKEITGLMDGSGEYTLVYEDNEGDRMLVGDVPWNMFVATVKRLRVLKSSDLSALNLVSGKQDQMK